MSPKRFTRLLLTFSYISQKFNFAYDKRFVLHIIIFGIGKYVNLVSNMLTVKIIASNSDKKQVVNIHYVIVNSYSLELSSFFFLGSRCSILVWIFGNKLFSVNFTSFHFCYQLLTKNFNWVYFWDLEKKEILRKLSVKLISEK